MGCQALVAEKRSPSHAKGGRNGDEFASRPTPVRDKEADYVS